MRHRWWFSIGFLCTVPAAAPATGSAQDSLPPWEGGITASLGQPPRTRWYAGGSFGLDWQGSATGADPIAYGLFGASRNLTNPVVGLAAAAIEGYFGLREGQLDGGIRALLVNTPFRLTLGADFNVLDRRVYPLLGFMMPVRRGGVFGGGSILRAEWSPGDGSAFRVSALIPLFWPAAGRTRPRHDEVSVRPRSTGMVPRPTSGPPLDESFARISVLATRIQRLVVPYIDATGADPVKALAPVVAQLRTLADSAPEGTGLGVEAAVRAYHAEVARAFSMAASGRPLAPGEATPAGEALAARARNDLLIRVLFPYDRLLGQRKTSETLRGLSAHARGNFARDLVSEFPDLTAERQAAALYVFGQLMATMDQMRAAAEEQWHDSRLVWLPLQFGLLPEQHDTQAKIDRILEQGVGQRFTDGNRVLYLINLQFHAEVTRSIFAARSYHVLWIHDFRGRNDEGQPDLNSLHYVVDAYLSALTRRVREYDSVRTLPVYMIFLDEHYYQVNHGRLWLDFLEDPLGSIPKMPDGAEASWARIREAQTELRAAVDSSRLLQAEVRQYGRQWLANLLKVQVNITNPADPSFWGPGILPLIGFPDNATRDHRKIVFYDITEEDPYRGEALYTGMGIGEHYTGPGWEDRAILAQGPAVLTLKEQARRLLRSQGIPEDQIPFPLRPRPRPSNYDVLVDAEIAQQQAAGARDRRAMELHNLTGYQDKPINVARAILYSLMPPGSVIKVPDSLWGNALYAALLTGSAFRGARVLFVAPSLRSAPSPGWPAMGLAHDLFARLIVLQQAFGPELQEAGGLLKTGIYNPSMSVEDVFGRLIAAYRNGLGTPVMRRLYPLDASVDSALVRMVAMAPRPAPGDVSGLGTVDSVRPKLHLKANFFASREGWDKLISSPELAPVYESYMARLLQPDSAGTTAGRDAARALSATSQRLYESFHAQLNQEERERVIYYLLVGSANEDYRSMFMDGEASVLLSGWFGVVSLLDFTLLLNLSVWVDDLELLDTLLPPPSGVQRRLARQLRPML
jgi:hypothetical protein